jgi:hypothetical protein
MILQRNTETSLKRRDQQQTYKEGKKNIEKKDSLISKLITAIKTHWYC